MSGNPHRLIKSAICLGLLTCFVFNFDWPAWAAKRQSNKIDFKRDIEPIFASACLQCHGAKKAAGQLRLDNKSLAMKGGISGAVILPGSSRQSRLLKRLLGEGAEPRMPLGGEPLKP